MADIVFTSLTQPPAPPHSLLVGSQICGTSGSQSSALLAGRQIFTVKRVILCYFRREIRKAGTREDWVSTGLTFLLHYKSDFIMIEHRF